MIKIGITGSISSGKTTASKIIAKKSGGVIFSADKIVKGLYNKRKFKKLLIKKLLLESKGNIKLQVKNKILKEKTFIKKLEKIVHPFVRSQMVLFKKKYSKKKLVVFEIPLLIESKLTKKFDKIIFIKSPKNLRLKRYIKNGGDKKLFSYLNKHQLSDFIKMKHCDHIVVNNKSLSFLKAELLNIINVYE